MIGQRRPTTDVSSQGPDSVSAILSAKVSSPNDELLAKNVRAVLGLENTFTSYLFTEINDQGDVVETLMAIAPRCKDVERYKNASA